MEISAASIAALYHGATVVEIVNDEADLKSPVSLRFDFGRESVAMTVKNTSQAPIAPAISAELFNRYGMLVGAFEASFASDNILAGDVRVRQLALTYPNIESIFKNSTIKLPDDWKQLRFAKVVVAGAQGGVDPQHPGPKANKRLNTRPKIFADDRPNKPGIGNVAVDAKWSNYGAYLQRFIDTVQTQWDRIVSDGKIHPASGSAVTVKFVMDSQGKIARIVNVDSTADETAARVCVGAIADPAPYGPWTDDMKKMLGDRQEMTFTFYYQ